MAIVEMRKLQLVAMAYEKDAILNALHRTGAAEITFHAPTERTQSDALDDEELKTYSAKVEAALASLSHAIENVEKQTGEKSGILKDGFDVSYSEFMSAESKKEEVDVLVEQIGSLCAETNLLKAELVKTVRLKEQAEIYTAVKQSLASFKDTAKTHVRLGILSANVKESCLTALDGEELCAYEKLNESAESVLLCIAAHKSVAAEIDSLLSAYGFSDCPYKQEESGAEIYAQLVEKETALLAQISKNEYTVYELKDKIRLLKIYCEYLDFTIEKAATGEKLRRTDSTFLLQAYVPAPAEESVKAELLSVSGAIFLEFSEPSEEDEPPILLKNNAIVSNFESITNTYSPPNYREFDPNAVMSFFYSLFMGFIIGDMGYGILMALIGGWLWWKNRPRPTGLSKLAGAFAIGGLFAIFWGALFNSFFGLAIFGAENTIMPNPQEDMWMLAGVAVPSVLIISMIIGVFQLCVGYVCKAVQCWRKGQFWDGIFDGITWTVFSIGVALAIVGFVDEAKLPALAYIGGIIAGVSLLIAIVTAGRKEKFFGKFTKGFGTVYGIINYASDILSYARLYGLMLSGAVIASIISGYGVDFITGGNIALAVLGVVILIVGHGFNLVMNLLGAYIHDARLQYVEFYGRFFEGEGELFAPLGSKRKYIYLTEAPLALKTSETSAS